MNHLIFKYNFIALLILSLFWGCSDNPADSNDEENHFEAIGLYVFMSGDTIVTYQGGNVTGEIEAEEGALTSLLNVKFITDEGEVGIPEGDEFSFDWEIADTSIAQLVSHGTELEEFKFHIQGKEEGETTIKIFINHHDHKDFESKAIDIHVHHNTGGHGEPAGLVLINETGDTLVTYDDHTGFLSGSEVTVQAGHESGHIQVQFFDDSGVFFTPDTAEHFLQLSVSDTSLAEIEQHAGEHWQFEILGKQAGTTTFTVDLWHLTHSDFKVDSIPLEVTP